MVYGAIALLKQVVLNNQ